MLHTGAFDVGELGIQDGIGADLRGVGAEEIADVDRLILVVREGFKDLRGGVAGDVACLYGVAHDYVRAVHKVDPIACSLGIPGVFGNHPAVEEEREAFLGEGELKVDALRGRLVACPDTVAAPVKACPAAFENHLVLAEIGLPARHERLNLL